MKHLIKRKFLQGGGKKKPKPQPPILNPPKLGAYEILSSYSVAEIVDLISDGPIEGLVNQNGQPLRGGASILQGVYLDNTPVQQTDLFTDENYNDGESIFKYEIGQTFKDNLGSIYFDENGNSKPIKHNFGNATDKTFVGHTDVRLISESNTFYSFCLPILFSKSRPRFGVKTYYSPLLSFSSKWYSIYNNDTDPEYAYTLDGKMEFHYKRAYQSFFDTKYGRKSFLAKLEEDLKAEQASTNPLQYKYFVAPALDKLNILKKEQINNPFSFENPNNYTYIVLKFGTKENPIQLKSTGAKVLNEQNEFEPSAFQLLNFSDFIKDSNIYYLLIPEISTDSENPVYTGKFYGSIVIPIPMDLKTLKVLKIFTGYARIRFLDTEPFNRVDSYISFKRISEGVNVNSVQAKYNFANVSCEFRDGGEFQKPLDTFKSIYVDFEYGKTITGPFKLSGNAQRINGSWDTRGPNAASVNVGVDDEGSNDQRDNTRNFSAWNDDNEFNEKAKPIVHTIENPNVSSIVVSISVNSLGDTTHVTMDGRDSGDKIPTIVVFDIEWGKVSNGIFSEQTNKTYAILGMVESSMIIDFGSKELSDIKDRYYGAIVDQYLQKTDVGNPINLPVIKKEENPSFVKRYVKITKRSCETNSVLIRKDISLYKVTEIVENSFSYPFSSIVGIKFDARSFSTVPERTYDCKLKKIKIPSNYEPVEKNGIDKRYLSSASQYASQSSPNLIYKGDWDGSFKIGWTDNPAWILYDLLTSERYGLGSYIDESQINKWELYKIARFCDSVDEEGYFQGVSDGAGGLEPRFSCNIVFREQTKIFDAINVVANLFRGIVFFSNSEIHFLDDRPRIPIALFTNSNVKDGIFNYINNRRDQQFNTVEVAYLDRLDNYQTKIEYIQDESDIRKRGVFKTQINTLGVTSRAMARRVGQHVIHQTIKENQTVEFSAGLESLLCRPGDLIVIEDDMKTRSSNYGRVLDVDSINKKLRLDNLYDNQTFAGRITVYTPTGYLSSDDLDDIASRSRNRTPYFDVSGAMLDSSDNSLTGRYYFSGYVDGYPSGNLEGLPVQFPFYTGISNVGHNIYCYFNTGATGFVFATGLPFQDNNLYSKVITNTGVADIAYFGSGSSTTGFRYSSSSSNKRTNPSGRINNKIINPLGSFRGILEEEIVNINIPQITHFNITGFENFNYGCNVLIDAEDLNINLLPLVAEGSAYRLERDQASDQIYKIISIREENQNEYRVFASKYDTGKYVSIENFVTEDFLPKTYYDGPLTINNIVINQLDAPSINYFDVLDSGAAGFSLTGTWSGVVGATGYEASIYNNLSQNGYSKVLSSSLTGFGVTGLTELGDWKFSVLSLGNNSNYLNSATSSTGVFVAYSTIAPLDKPVINGFTLI